MIYFVQQPNGVGPIKIGQSSHLDTRIRQMRSDHKIELVVLATADGDFITERNLHLKFADERTIPSFAIECSGKTEWFEASSRLLEYIEAVKASGQITLTIDEQRERQFAERYIAGETLQAIATDFGITRERVRQVLRRDGVASLGHRPCNNRTKISLEVEGEIVALGNSGVPQADIARSLGLSRANVGVYLRKHGISVPRARVPVRPETIVKAQEIAGDYLAGIKTADIAEKYGLVQPEIYRFLRIAGVKPQRQRAKFEVPETLIAKYKAGVSARSIAAEMDCDPGKLREALRAQGVEVRPHKVANSIRRCAPQQNTLARQTGAAAA